MYTNKTKTENRTVPHMNGMKYALKELYTIGNISVNASTTTNAL